jgi:hypothetical protein
VLQRLPTFALARCVCTYHNRTQSPTFQPLASQSSCAFFFSHHSIVVVKTCRSFFPQWVSLNFPSLGRFEWHPFSPLLEVQEDAESGNTVLDSTRLCIYIKKKRGWTKEMYGMMRRGHLESHGLFSFFIFVFIFIFIFSFHVFGVSMLPPSLSASFGLGVKDSDITFLNLRCRLSARQWLLWF